MEEISGDSREKDRHAEALRKALFYLQIRPRSTEEVNRYLARKGFDQDITDAVVRKLKDLEYLDDESFARNLARNGIDRKGHAALRLRRDMEKYGLGQDLIEAELEKAFNETDEDTLAEELARKYLAKYPDISLETKKRRLWAYLDRKGYRSSSIRRVLESLGILEI